MGIKFYDSNGKYWGEYDETRNLFIPSEETITQTETQNSNLTFENRTMLDCYNCKRYKSDDACVECRYEPIADTPQNELTAKCLNCHNAKACKENHWDGCIYEPQTDCAWMYDSRRDYEYDKALDEMERNFVEFEEYDDGEQETDTTDI